jgi:hypothetical protein
MEHNSNVEQYFRISENFLPTDWMIISQSEDYAIILGKGFHQLMGNFLEQYDADSEYIFNKKSNKVIKIPDIFLVKEKKVFTTEFTSIIDYPLREEQNLELQEWVEKYQETHSNLSVYYEDEDIKIYRIHQEPEQKDIVDKIWGN